MRSLYGHCTVTVISSRFSIKYGSLCADTSQRRYRAAIWHHRLLPPSSKSHPVRLVQAPAPARHVRNSVVEEAPRQACRSAAQTTEIFILGLPARAFPLKLLSPHTAVDLLPQRVTARIQVGAARGDVYKTDDDNRYRQVSTLTFETATAATQ